MDLSSNLKLTRQFETSVLWMDNVSITSSDYEDSGILDVIGISTLLYSVTAITGSGLSIQVRGNVLNSNLDPLNMYNEAGDIVTEMTEAKNYYVDVSGIAYVRLYTTATNTATAVSIAKGEGTQANILPYLASINSTIEDRSKIVTLASIIDEVPANDVINMIISWTDVSKYSYIVIRVRSRDASSNTYETRDYTCKISWGFEKPDNIYSGATGATRLETIINETAEYETITDWIEIKSNIVQVGIYSGEITPKDYEVDLIGIR